MFWLLGKLFSVKRSKMFRLIVVELSGHNTIKEVPITSDKLRLRSYLGDSWKNFFKARVNGVLLHQGWFFYVPCGGDVIELYAEVSVKAFSSAYIQALNEQYQSGRFLKAVILTEDPSISTKKYYVDNETSITFQSNTYSPLEMSWSGYTVSAAMPLPTMTVNISNIGGEVIDYLETLDIIGNDVVLQILHIDRSGVVEDVTTAKDEVALQVQSIVGDDMVASFTLGLNLGLNDMLPRGVMTKAKYPGMIDDVIRLMA